jgi:3-isopropylmalate dehydrogenase
VGQLERRCAREGVAAESAPGSGCFANLRPAILYPQLAAASALKAELVAGLDILIVRELTGGIYFGEPRGIRTLAERRASGLQHRWSTASPRSAASDAWPSSWRASAAGAAVLGRQGQRARGHGAVARGDGELAAEYPDVELSHMYVDNAAMQLVRAPKQFDVMVTGNHVR